MKNRKGFTLVELMAVIVVLAIIIAIAVPAYNGIKTKIDQKNYENKIDLIEVAAAKFSEDTKYETMYVDDLIKSGYLDADDEKGYIYDPRDKNKIMNCYLVQSVEEAGIYYSKVIEKEYGLQRQCEANIPNSMNTGLKIKMYKDTGEEITGTTHSKWWANTDVKLKAEVNIKEGQSVEKYEWYRGYDQTPTSTSGAEIMVKSTSVLQQNYTLKVTLNDGKIMNTTVRVYIDKIEPNFYDKDTTKDKTINNKWIKDLKYGIKAYDNESGLYGYKIYNSIDELPNGNCLSDFKEYDKKNKNKEIKVNGEYPVCIIDNAGNVHKEVLELTKIDNTDMSCHFEITGTKGYIVDGNQWYIKDDLTLTLKADKIGPSGVSLGISTTNTESYTTEFITDMNKAYTDKILDSNQNGVKYYGYIKNQADTKNSCNTTIYFEKGITAPTKVSSSSGYDKITINYTSGSAISGIANTTCERTDSNGNKIASGILNGNNCEFNVTATLDNTSYYFKKCITSKAGNTECSSVSEIKNIGYCTEGNYSTTKERIANSEGACNKKCDTGTRTYKYKDVYTSNYKSYSCGKSEEKSGTENCNTQTCCSKTKYVAGAWGSCSDVCGGNQTRKIDIVSYYDNSTTCTTASNSENTRPIDSQSCGGKKHTSSSACVATCPTACGQAASTINGTKTKYYVSTEDATHKCPSESEPCSKSCPATAACYDTLSITCKDEYVNPGHGKIFCVSGKMTKKYTTLKYSFNFTTVNAAHPTCDIRLASNNEWGADKGGRPKNITVLSSRSTGVKSNEITIPYPFVDWNSTNNKYFKLVCVEAAESAGGTGGDIKISSPSLQVK